MGEIKLKRSLDKVVRKAVGVKWYERIVYIDADPSFGNCVNCGREDELRFGWCYPCAMNQK